MLSYSTTVLPCRGSLRVLDCLSQPLILLAFTQKANRDNALKRLNVIYDEVAEHNSDYLDTAFTKVMKIECRTLTLESEDKSQPTDTNRFFQPCPADRIYPIDDDHGWTQEDIQSSKATWELYHDDNSPGLGKAKAMCYELGSAFRCRYRKTKDGKSTTLSMQSSWHPADLDESMFLDDFEAGVWNPRWQPVFGWRAPDGSTQPHVMFTMAHDFEGSTEGHPPLLRGEVLAIVAAMITRLESKDYEEHNIIPVMVFSFTGDEKGRVLQAQFDKEGLVIKSTSLYDLSKWDMSRKYFNVFLRFLCSERIGDTKRWC